MAAYSGSALSLSWIYSGGTVALNGDYRQCNYEPSVAMINTTAGSDANEEYIAGVKGGQASFSALMQANGTAMFTALAEGTSGTLKIYPEGTAAGKPSITIPAISQGVRWNIPYNDAVEISVTWTQNGARS